MPTPPLSRSARGQLTREGILQIAFTLASENGLASLTIGDLAKQVGMSKSGLYAHFQAKQNLQLAVIDYANRVFSERVIQPARLAEHSQVIAKLRQLLQSWLAWNHAFHGSCMFLDAWTETAHTPGECQVALRASIRRWLDYLEEQFRKGIEAGQLKPNLDPAQAAFSLYGCYLSYNLYYNLVGEQQSQQRFWLAVEQHFALWQQV